jgi:hypothetical protein
MASVIGKWIFCGACAGALTLLSPGAFAADPQFSGAPVHEDAYNAVLAGLARMSDTLDARFSGRLAYLDPYNATLAAAGLPSTATAALAEFATTYAFASDYPGPAVWESVNRSDK